MQPNLRLKAILLYVYSGRSTINELFPYTDNKNKFVNNKSLKLRLFKDSIDQIEEDILGKLKNNEAKKEQKRKASEDYGPPRKRARVSLVRACVNLVPVTVPVTAAFELASVASNSFAIDNRCGILIYS